MANKLAILEEGQKRWGSGILLEHDSTTVEDISKYVRYKIVEYRITDLKDSDFWDVFQEDFTGFTTEIFKSCIPVDIWNLRRLLRKNGVWVIKDRHILVAQSLFNMLQEKVLSSHFTIGESIGMEKIECIELCVESVYVKRWEGPSYREPPTAIVKAPETRPPRP